MVVLYFSRWTGALGWGGGDLRLCSWGGGDVHLLLADCVWWWLGWEGSLFVFDKGDEWAVVGALGSGTMKYLDTVVGLFDTVIGLCACPAVGGSGSGGQVPKP